MIAGAFLIAMLAAGEGATCPPITLPAGVAITLVTTAPLSSKTSVKGDIVPLRTVDDVQVDGHIVIARGTEAIGQISDARSTGGLGVGGLLAIRPLYLKTATSIVRLTGATTTRGGAPAGTVVGLAVLTPVISGRSATVPTGSAIPAVVEKSVVLHIVDSSASLDKGCPPSAP
jgi:hypothetical protein